jgi:hypothetical protein
LGADGRSPARLHAAALFERVGVEVQQEFESANAEPEVGLQLGVVQRCDPLHRLEFESHFVANDDVGSVAVIQQDAAIVKWQFDLTGVRDTVPVEFMAKAALVATFQQARAEA